MAAFQQFSGQVSVRPSFLLAPMAAKSPTPVALEDTAFRNKSPALEAEMVLLRNRSDKSALSLLSSGTWLKLLFPFRMHGR